jgi:hypothetical protein
MAKTTKPKVDGAKENSREAALTIARSVMEQGLSPDEALDACKAKVSASEEDLQTWILEVYQDASPRDEKAPTTPREGYPSRESTP